MHHITPLDDEEVSARAVDLLLLAGSKQQRAIRPHGSSLRSGGVPPGLAHHLPLSEQADQGVVAGPN